MYDCTRPWRDQLDEDAIETMIRTHAPDALERLGLERLLTVKRMIDEYLAGNLTRTELITLASHYDGLMVGLTPLGEDPEPHPEEGDPFWDVYTASMRHTIDDDLYEEWFEAMRDKD